MQPYKNTTELDVATLVSRMIAERTITYQQHQALTRLVLADGRIDESERRQINRLFDAIQTGLVKIVS